MDSILREAVITEITSSRRKKVDINRIQEAIQRQPLGFSSDFEIEKRLLTTLETLEKEGLLRLPSKRFRGKTTRLPQFVTAIRTDQDAEKQKRKEYLDQLRYKTSWEPTLMAAFAHTLKDVKELERAIKVNRYLLSRKPGAITVPHRERALEVFGNEKALDRNIPKGLFGGKITFAHIDCFYCPEPLPFHPFSPDRRKTAGKPLLVVENSNTYWSSCVANETLGVYAAVVYGKGFHAHAAERAIEGLFQIETRMKADGIAYFGDLDPTGIAIPLRINGYRREKGLTPLYAERRLYRALLKKNLWTPYAKSQKKDNSPARAKEWLGKEIADIYLENANDVRWPQEGLRAKEIVIALENSGHAKS